MHPFFVDREQKSLYETFLKHCGGGVTQSWEWGEFRAFPDGEKGGWVLGVGSPFLVTALVVKQSLPFGLCWLSVARGPVFLSEVSGVEVEKIWGNLWGEILKLAKRERAVFVRVELPQESPLKLSEAEGWLPAHAHYHPEWTRMVDLAPSPDTILAQMKPKGRYNIKVAQKNGVTVRVTHRPEDVTAFCRILTETGGRDGFGIHPEAYYQTLVKMAHEGGWGELYLAEVGHGVISGLFATFYGGVATYYYGASASQHRAMMAPYLLQWEAIQEAKRRGCEWYDFLGVAPPEAGEQHPWAGITAFKEKFGGVLVGYPPAKEFVTRRWWYRALMLYKNIKKLYK